ncbi:MAG: general secretion pathway protein GspB [Georgfuchsia sp.]
MSNVLEALRKSEQERQMAAGQSTGILYPVMVEQRRSWLAPTLLVGAALVILAVAMAWWLLRQTPAPDIPPDLLVTAKESIVIAPQVAVPAEPVVVAKPASGQEVEKTDIPARAAIRQVQPSMVEAVKTEPVDESPPNDLPALDIAGYIRNEQGKSLAMINDKLVAEGDEVAPGVRLEKILGDASIFSYKGYRFRR